MYGYDPFEGFPTIRIALFSAIAGVVFLILGMSPISTLFFFAIPLVVVFRIFTFWFVHVERRSTRFTVASLGVGLEASLLGATFIILSGAEGVLAIIGGVFLGIAGIAYFLAAMGFLVSVFIAFFL